MAAEGNFGAGQAGAPGKALNPGATGLRGMNLQRFQQEVAAEIGIDLNRAAAAQAYVRQVEPATHSRNGAGQSGGR